MINADAVGALLSTGATLVAAGLAVARNNPKVRIVFCLGLAMLVVASGAAIWSWVTPPQEEQHAIDIEPKTDGNFGFVADRDGTVVVMGEFSEANGESGRLLLRGYAGEPKLFDVTNQRFLRATTDIANPQQKSGSISFPVRSGEKWYARQNGLNGATVRATWYPN